MVPFLPSGLKRLVVAHKFAAAGVAVIVGCSGVAVSVWLVAGKDHSSSPTGTHSSTQGGMNSANESGSATSSTSPDSSGSSSSKKSSGKQASSSSGSGSAGSTTSGGGSSQTNTGSSGDSTSGGSASGSGSSGNGGSAATNTPPTAPTGATASIVQYNRVTIHATPATDSDGIARHELLRNGSVVATTTSTSNPVVLSDTSVTVGATYTYVVRAVDTKGAVGPSSNSVNVTIPPRDTTAPSVPTNFRVTSNTAGSVTFAWDVSTDNQTAQGNLWYIITSPLDESDFYTWTQTNPYTTGWFDTPGVSHQVYIQAVDEAGNTSAKAGPVTFTAQ